MSIPNIGPELPDDVTAGDGPRKANPALVYRDEPVTDEVQFASVRASVVSHRFGGVRYALTRRIKAERAWEPPVGGESDESQ
ncbi:MAG: hypothetical protein QOE51_2883 [Actinoplanes sp.]|jgi:hypothetical protein|nr:hypothetical protein [Actinoplanes sp.]